MTDDPEKLSTLKNLLESANAQFTIFRNDANILTVEDGAHLVSNDFSKLAPTFILETEVGFIAAVIPGDTSLSYKKIKQELHLKNVSLASPQMVKQLTGAEVGQVSLVNPNLQTIVDLCLLEKEYVFGGCGVSHHTLKIKPQALVAVTHARVFDFTEKKIQPG